jgi:hypothetical protein
MEDGLVDAAHLKYLIVRGFGISNLSKMSASACRKLPLLMTLFGKYCAYSNLLALSQMSNSQTFFPLSSTIGLEQKSSCHSVMSLKSSPSSSEYSSESSSPPTTASASAAAAPPVLGPTTLANKCLLLRPLRVVGRLHLECPPTFFKACSWLSKSLVEAQTLLICLALGPHTGLILNKI